MQAWAASMQTDIGPAHATLRQAHAALAAQSPEPPPPCCSLRARLLARVRQPQVWVQVRAGKVNCARAAVRCKVAAAAGAAVRVAGSRFLGSGGTQETLHILQLHERAREGSRGFWQLHRRAAQGVGGRGRRAGTSRGRYRGAAEEREIHSVSNWCIPAYQSDEMVRVKGLEVASHGVCPEGHAGARAVALAPRLVGKSPGEDGGIVAAWGPAGV